ncbi:hypothetical protein [Citrobacter amalonaticus]|uniref:hypothetical protein n=1 Tax=Citrobacter amalonaticus TaxID=35703 RepID=UPI00300CD5E0
MTTLTRLIRPTNLKLYRHPTMPDDDADASYQAYKSKLYRQPALPDDDTDASYQTYTSPGSPFYFRIQRVTQTIA